MSNADKLGYRARWRQWRARRCIERLLANNLLLFVPDDQPHLAHYWTYLRCHPNLLPERLRERLARRG